MGDNFALFVKDQLINFIEEASRSNFSEFSIQGPGIKFIMKKGESPSSSSLPPAQVSMQEEVSTLLKDKPHTHLEVKSNWVGLYYNPEKNLAVGDTVQEEQLLGTVKSMNLPFDIKCPADGKIIEIMIENEGIVEYGQTLFKINKAREE